MTDALSNTLSQISPAASSPTREQPDQQRMQHASEQLNTIQDGPSASSAEELLKEVQRINESLRPFALHFELQAESARTVIRVVDSETGGLIRTIPSETVLRIAQRAPAFQGLLLDEKS